MDAHACEDSFAQLHEARVRLRYRRIGVGATKVLLIMGFATPLEAWRYQMEYFEALDDDVEVCVFDNRGAGKSSAPRSWGSVLTTSTATMAEDAIDLVRSFGWHHVHVVGVSMGGMVAMELATRAPEVVASLTLINTHAGGIRAIAPVKGMYYIARLFVFQPRKVTDKRGTAEMVLDLLYGSNLKQARPDDHERLLQHHVDAIDKRPKATARGFLSHLLSVSSHYVSKKRLQRLSAAKVPVAIFVSGEDRLVRTSNSHIVHGILRDHNAKVEGETMLNLHEFPECGHGLAAEAHVRFNRLLHEHIRASNEFNQRVKRDLVSSEEFTIGSHYARPRRLQRHGPTTRKRRVTAMLLFALYACSVARLWLRVVLQPRRATIWRILRSLWWPFYVAYASFFG